MSVNSILSIFNGQDNYENPSFGDRVIRYLIPGVVFDALLFILLLITSTSFIPSRLITSLFPQSDFKIQEAIFFLIVLLLITFGIGYIFSFLFIHFFWESRGIDGYNHKKLLATLPATISCNGSVITNNFIESLSNRDAWLLFHILKRHLLPFSPSLQMSTIFINRQVDLLHCIGASKYAVYSALLFWSISSIDLHLLHYDKLHYLSSCETIVLFALSLVSVFLIVFFLIRIINTSIYRLKIKIETLENSSMATFLGDPLFVYDSKRMNRDPNLKKIDIQFIK